jgi:hypothetical protein
MRRVLAALALTACHGSGSATASATATATPTPTLTPTPTPTPTPVPTAIQIAPTGVGFDDLVFAPATHRLLFPAGATGEIVAVDRDTFAVTRLHVFPATSHSYAHGHHDDGVTSAAEGGGRLYATDHASSSIVALDLRTGAKVASAKLASEPDYVRFVLGKSATEVWVTEPDRAQIEVFTPDLQRKTVVAVPGGPESLVVDAPHDVAYSNLWHGKSVAIDLGLHRVRDTYDSGCARSRGIALDPGWGLLFVGCNEGKVQVVDLAKKKLVASVPAADGIDIIDYDVFRHRLFAPGARSGTMSVFSVARDGTPTLTSTVPVAKGSHCVVVDDRGRAWVCDVDGGRILVR